MTIGLSENILNKFLQMMEQDASIGKDLAKKIHSAICINSCTKEDIESVLKKEAESINNENS